MGTWGTGPFDNDYAGNTIARLFHDPANKALKLPMSVSRKNRSRGEGAPHQGRSFRHIASDYYEAARFGIAVLVIAHGKDILGGPPLIKAVEVLHKMRSDQDWLAIWNDPKKIARAIVDEMDEIYEVMKHCERCTSESVDEALRLLGEAAKFPVPKPAERPKKKRTTKLSRHARAQIRRGIRR